MLFHLYKKMCHKAYVFIVIYSFSMISFGQVNLEGIWTPNMPPWEAQPRLDELRLTPEGQEAFDRFSAEDDPSFRCVMPGVPRGLIDPYPLEVIQQDHQIVFLREYHHQVRRIYMDGRQPPELWPPTLNGYSVGYWEDETLVVTTTHLSPDNYMDVNGRPFSGDEETYVVERYTRMDNTLFFIAEIHDPKFYMQPYIMHYSWDFSPEGEIWEYVCDARYGGVE